MKYMSLLIIITLLAVPMVIAQETEQGMDQIPSSIVQTGDGYEEGGPGEGTSLSFVSGIKPYSRIRKVWKASSPNYFAKITENGDRDHWFGAGCEVGDYIVPMRCKTQWGGCERIFDEDFVKEDTSNKDKNLVNMRYYTDDSWYQEWDDEYPWDLYQCRVPVEEKSPAGEGYFKGTVNYDSSVHTNEEIHIKGSFYATKSGPMLLEAHVDLGSKQPLAVAVESSESSCDGSKYWAGKEFNARAGKTYNYDLTVRTPAEPGKYRIYVQAWTDCYDLEDTRDGKTRGQMFDQTYGQVTVKKSVTCKLTEWYDSVTNSGKFSTTNSAAYSAYSAYGCTKDDIDEWCGTTDSDGDTIPDDCDYCPRDRGDVLSQGCHPCYGLDVYSYAAKDCYRSYYKEYGIDPTTEKIVNPIVDVVTSCNGDEVITEKIRDFGNVASSEVTDTCGANEECKVDSNGNAACSKIEVTPTGNEKICKNGNVAVRTTFSDGSKEITNTNFEDCEGNGCEDGTCIPPQPDTTCKGQECVEEGEQGLTSENPECEVDQDCSVGYYCDVGQCFPMDNFCYSSSDCDSGYICNQGECVEGDVPECVTNAGCSVGYKCKEEVCVKVTGQERADLAKINKNKLSGKPSRITAAQGHVFSYYDIAKTDSASADENVAIDISVEKSWLSENGIDPTKVVISHYKDGEWNDLPASIVDETTTDYTYRSFSRDFSYFAVRSDAEEEPYVEESCNLFKSCSEGFECNSGNCVPIVEEGDSTTVEDGAECFSDSECDSNQECVSNQCHTTVEWEDNGEDLGSCTENTFVTCKSGGKVITEICVQGEKVPTDKTCMSEFDEETKQVSNGPVSWSSKIGGINVPGVEKIKVPFIKEGNQPSKDETLTFGAIGILVIGVLAYIFVVRKTPGKRRKRK